MRSLREFVVLLGVSLGALVASGPATSYAQAAQTGLLQVIVLGEAGSPLAGVGVEVAGKRQDTNAEGTAELELPVGVQQAQLDVPHALVPQAPIDGDKPWRVELSDLPIVKAQATSVRVTLSASGGVAGLELTAPQSAAVDMEKQYEKALRSGPRSNVSGSVTAREDGSTVSDAHVYVRGAPVETLTDGQGSFRLELPQGRWSLAVIHPEYSTYSLPDLSLHDGEDRELKVELAPRSMLLDEYTVKAPHVQGGIAQLVAERRETTAVADVIGAEQMARSGDTSAASALSRVTGLTVVDGRFVIVRGLGERYSSMTLNRMQVPSPEPTRRVVPLDLFPAGVLESVVVQKSYSPDLPGEFGGGLVQVRSRDYPDKFLLNLTLTGQFNSQTHLRDQLDYAGGGRDWLGYDDGTRQLPSAIGNSPKLIPGNIFSKDGYTPEQLDQFGRSLPNRWNRKKQFVPLDFGVVGSVGNKWNLRYAKLGFVAAVAYKSQYNAVRDAITRTIQLENGKATAADDFRLTTVERQISTSAFLDWGVEFSKHHKLKFTTMLLRQSEDGTIFRSGFDNDLGAPTQVTRLSWVERQVFLQQVGGGHTFDRLRDLHLDWRYGFGRATRYEPDRRDYEYTIPPGATRFELASGPSNQRLWGDLTDTTHEGQLDFVQPFPVWSSLEAKLKLGAFLYRRSREAWVRRFEYNVSSSLSPDIRTLPPEQIFTPANINQQNAAFREVSLSNDTYDASLDLQAGYATMELPIYKRLDITGGARLEHSLIKVTTFDQFNPGAPPEISRLDNLDVLPAATATWRFIDDFQLRFGYGKTLNRPDLRELSSGQFNDIEANARLLGNPALKRATIDNLDTRLEWYFSTDESVSIGAFYKKFSDPIEASILAGAEIIYSFVNSPSAKTRGLEFDMRKRFNFLHEKLESMYFAGNLTLIDSEVDVQLNAGGRHTRPLQSQSPWVVNAQLGYDDSAPGGIGLAAAMMYNVSGRRIRAVGDPNIGTPDQYEEPFHRLDLVVSQGLPHGLRIGVKAQNLLNAEQTWKQGDVVVRRFRRGTDVAASLSWSY